MNSFKNNIKFILFDRHPKLTETAVNTFKSYNFRVTNDINNIADYDIIVCHPPVHEEIAAKYPDTVFRIINIYNERETPANPVYNTYDTKSQNISSDADIYNIVMSYQVYANESDNFIDWAIFLNAEINAFTKICQMVEEIKIKSCLLENPKTKKTIMVMKNLQSVELSTSVFAENALHSDEGLTRITREWLRLQHSSFKKAEKYTLIFKITMGFVTEAVEELNLRLRDAGIRLSEDDLIETKTSNNDEITDSTFSFKKIIYTYNLTNVSNICRREHVDMDVFDISDDTLYNI